MIKHQELQTKKSNLQGSHSKSTGKIRLDEKILLYILFIMLCIIIAKKVYYYSLTNAMISYPSLYKEEFLNKYGYSKEDNANYYALDTYAKKPKNVISEKK